MGPSADAHREAEYSVATEKCETLAGFAKTACMASAQSRFGKNSPQLCLACATGPGLQPSSSAISSIRRATSPSFSPLSMAVLRSFS